MKKALTHPKADQDARQGFRERSDAHERDARPIVHIDGSGFAHDMARTHGYAPRGQRCPGQHDRNAKGRVNVIGAVLAGVLLCVGLTEANADADIPSLWPEPDLIPGLPSEAVPVTDRATVHRRGDTKTLIKAAGHIPEDLPRYSPDLNDIGHKWAQAMAYGRKTGKPAGEIVTDKTWKQN